MPPSPRRDSLAPPTSSPTSTRAAAAANTPQSPRTRYQSGHVLDHVDSYILRGEDMTHSPGESRLPSPVPSIRGGDEREATGRREEDAEERTLTSGSGNGSVGRDGLDEAEKGLRSRKGAPTEEAEKRASRNSSDGEKSADPATRRWKNDVVTFDSKDDLANPKNWSFRRRYFLVALLGLTTMCSTFASSIFSTATPAVAAEFGVSTEVATLGTYVARGVASRQQRDSPPFLPNSPPFLPNRSLFLAGFILGPIIFGPLSEVYGRKTIFSSRLRSLPPSSPFLTRSSVVYSRHICVHLLQCGNGNSKGPPDHYAHAVLGYVHFAPSGITKLTGAILICSRCWRVCRSLGRWRSSRRPI